MIGEEQSPFRIDASGRDGRISFAQADEHSNFIIPGDQPKDAPGTIEDRVGQRQPASPLIDPGHGNVGVGDLEDRIAGHQRSGVPIRP